MCHYLAAARNKFDTKWAWVEANLNISGLAIDVGNVNALWASGTSATDKARQMLEKYTKTKKTSKKDGEEE